MRAAALLAGLVTILGWSTAAWAQVALVAPSGGIGSASPESVEASLRAVIDDMGWAQVDAKAIHTAIGADDFADLQALADRLGTRVVLIAGAEPAAEGIVLTVTTFVAGADAPAVDSRVASPASAPAQAREMVRIALRTRAASTAAEPTVQATDVAAPPAVVGEKAVENPRPMVDRSLVRRWAGAALGTTLSSDSSLFPAPLSLSVRVFGRWNWIGAELDLDVLWATIYDYYDDEDSEHDAMGAPYVFIGTGPRFIANGVEPFTPYLSVLFQQVFETEKHVTCSSLGLRIGAGFQWTHAGFYFDGGLSFPFGRFTGEDYNPEIFYGKVVYFQFSLGLTVGAPMSKKHTRSGPS